MNNNLAELTFGSGLIRNIDKDRGRVTKCSNTDRVRGCACLWMCLFVDGLPQIPLYQS